MLNKGGGSNRLPGLVTKQQAVEFPQVLTIISLLQQGIIHYCVVILVSNFISRIIHEDQLMVNDKHNTTIIFSV